MEVGLPGAARARMGLLFSLVSATCYALLPILSKLALASGLTSLETMQLRYGFGVCFVFLYLLARKPSFLRISPSGLLWALSLSFCLDQVTGLELTKSFETLSASTGILLFYLFPAIVTLLSAVIHKTPVTRYGLASIAMVASGCCLIFLDAFSGSFPMVGIRHAMLSAFTFALHLTLLQKVMERVRPLTITFYVMLFTAIGFQLKGDLGLFCAVNTHQLTIGILLGLFPTALAAALLYVAIEMTDSGFAALCSAIEPAITVCAAFVILKEGIVPVQIFGMGFVMAGIYVKYLDTGTMRQRGLSGPGPVEKWGGQRSRFCKNPFV